MQTLVLYSSKNVSSQIRTAVIATNEDVNAVASPFARFFDSLAKRREIESSRFVVSH